MGLLSSLFPNEDASTALGLLGASMMGGNMPQGLLAANQFMSEAPRRKMQEQLLQAQIAETLAQGEERKLKLKQADALQGVISRIFNAAPPAAVYGPGQLGSGSFGATAPMSGQPAIPAPQPVGSRIGNASADDIAALSLMPGGKDLTPLWKTVKEGFERKPGSFYEDVTGRRQFVPDVKAGMDYRDGRINAIPGYSDFLTQQTLAQEAPKALLSAAGRVNLRDAGDGTQIPVSEIDENSALRNILQGVLGGRTGVGAPTGAAAAPAPFRAAPAAPPAPFAARVTPDEQKARDAESIRILQSEINNEQNPQVRASLQKELNRMTAAQSQPGFPTPTLKISPGLGYGKTTTQKTAEEVEKARLLEQTKADVRPTAQSTAALDNAYYMYGLVDKAIKHPGRETATGLSGAIDPRNYISGTSAKDFHAIREQIQGSAFLKAFESLKGGGQITQIEGEKATNAIIRMQTAQSDGAFKEALEEFQGIVSKGIERMGGKVPGAAPAVGAVESGYRFLGGNPADPKSWVKQ